MNVTCEDASNTRGCIVHLYMVSRSGASKGPRCITQHALRSTHAIGSYVERTVLLKNHHVQSTYIQSIISSCSHSFIQCEHFSADPSAVLSTQFVSNCGRRTSPEKCFRQCGVAAVLSIDFIPRGGGRGLHGGGGG